MDMFNLRNRHFLLLDILIFSLMPAFALILRLDTLPLPTSLLPGLALYTVVSLTVRVLVFYSFGLYRRFWRYASIEELLQLGVAALVALVLITPLYFIWRAIFPSLVFARSLLIIDSLLTLAGAGGVRFSVRLRETRHRNLPASNMRRVLIMGAGDAGAMVVRELQRNLQRGLVPVAFVDDDLGKQQMKLHGVPVLGTRKDIPRIASTLDIDQVVIALPTASGKIIREVVGTCEQLGVKTKTIPSIHEILNGAISFNQLRDVQIEDLLRREPVETELAVVQEMIAGKRILVTGGGGSIGSELCRQILRCRPSKLVILGHGENSIFDAYNELRRLTPKGARIIPLIADTRFPERISMIVKQHRPQIIFHAAAHKHVPLMELNPSEAITNNVLGTRNLLNAAVANSVDHFVMISTDKAVNPTSIMGASKRTAELLVHQAAIRSGKPYVAVRFGNVLGSRGSVVLTFKRQIATGGPVIVTDPEMKRYFMTIPEAVQLVLQASVLSSGGELFVLDMGEPVKIVDMARDLIELSGLEVGLDIEIRFSGIRPGEKLFEELFIPGEAYHRTRHDKIFIAGNASSFVPEDLDLAIDALEAAARRNDRAEIMRVLKNLLPEYNPMKNAPLSVPQKIANEYAGPNPATFHPSGSGDSTASNQPLML